MQKNGQAVEEHAMEHPFRTSLQWISARLEAVPQGLRILLLTAALGFITHGFVYANTLLAHDNLHLYAASLSALRWSSLLFYAPRAFLQIPWVIGLFSLLELGVVNVLLARMLSLRKVAGQMLLVVTTVTFPSTIAFHNYGSVDLFMGPLLFSVLAVYLLQRKGASPLLLSIALLTLSIAAYQAFVCTAAALALLLLLSRLTLRQDSLKAVLLDAGKALVVIGASIALYFAVYKVLTRLGAPGATSYRGQDAMGVFTAGELLHWILQAYVTVGKYALSQAINPLPLWVSLLQWACLALVTVCMAVRLATGGFFRQPGRVLLALAVLALLPLAVNGIQVLNNGSAPHLLMTFAFIAPWFLVLQYGQWLLDQPPLLKGAHRRQKRLAALCALLMGLNGYYGYILANADYLARKMNYDASLSLATRLVDRIENIEGYTPETPVVITGSPYRSYAVRPREGFELAYRIVGGFADHGHAITYHDSLGSTIEWYIGTVLSSNMVFLPSHLSPEYGSMEEVAALRPFPEKNCYAWIGDVLVLKLSE